MAHVEVTMHVFSGRENPKWKIDKNHHKFRKIVEEVEKYVEKDFKKGLGYSGFTVCHDNKKYQISKNSHVELEKILLHSSNDIRESSSVQRFISESVMDHVLEQLDKQIGQEGDLSLPKYDPRRWNIPKVEPYNNCYNYANNMITDTFAQPGRAHGLHIEKMTGLVVQTNAKADGLQVVPPRDTVPTDVHNLVALVIWPSTDFHWYRLDGTKTFSHKPGQSFVRNIDENGKTITDPRKCDRGPYTEFVTFMKTDPNLVSIN